MCPWDSVSSSGCINSADLYSSISTLYSVIFIVLLSSSTLSFYVTYSWILVLFNIFSFSTESVSFGLVLALSPVLILVLKFLLVKHTHGIRPAADCTLMEAAQRQKSPKLPVPDDRDLSSEISWFRKNSSSCSRILLYLLGNCIIIQKGCPTACLSPQVLIILHYVLNKMY